MVFKCRRNVVCTFFIRRQTTMGYEFRDVIKASHDPNDVISEAITWNGVALDKKVPGFRTLKVQGREDNRKTVTKMERPGDGSQFGYAYYDEKDITVTFSLLANNATEFMKRWDLLRQTLITDNYQEAKFSFADEPGTCRFGTLKALDNPSDGKLNVIGTLTIGLTKPFKYVDAKTVTLNNGTKLTDLNLIYPIMPDKLVIKKPTQPIIKINGTNKNITFHAAYDSGMDIVIDFDAMTVKRETSNVMDGLDLKTTLGSFKVKNGNVFNISGCEAIELTYKAVII